MSFHTIIFRFVVLSALLLLTAVAHAQPCDLSLRGRVIDDHDRTPLSFAEVFIPELGRGAVSDLDGYYVISGLCRGTYQLRVTHLGCDPVERKVVLDRDLVMDLRLEHHVEELRELEVISTRPDENVGLAREEVGRTELELSAGRSFAEVLHNLPGVTLLNSGPTTSKVVIQGHSGNRVLTLNQGIRQEDQQWGGDHAPNMDPFTADRITVVKGAASVQYGADAIGGVILSEPVELPRTPGIGGEVRGVGIYNGRGGGASGSLHGGLRGIPGFGWRVQGSGRMLGDQQAPEYVLSNTGLREAAGSASVGVQRHWGGATLYYSWFGRDLGVLRAAHIGNLTDLNNAIASGRPWFVAPFTYDIGNPHQTVQHHLFKAEAKYRVSDRNMILLTYGYQGDERKEFDNRRGALRDRPSIDLFLATHTGDAILNHWLGPHIHGKVGVNVVYQENFNQPGTGIRPLIPNYARTSGGVFILEHFPLRDDLELEAGARLEAAHLRVGRFNAANEYETPEHRFTNYAFSAGGNWSIRDHLQLRANIGSAFRPPHVVELYSQGLHHGSAAIERGDPTLPGERSLKATTDLAGSWFEGRLKGSLSLFWDRIDDYIYLRPAGTQLTIRGAFPVFDYVATDAMLHGGDATVEFTLHGPFRVRVRAGTVRGRDLGTNEWLFQMPSDRVEQTLLFNKETWGPLRDAEIALSLRSVFQQQRIPVDLDFMAPPATYQLLALSVSMARPLGDNELRFGLQGANLLNVAYRDYMDRFRYYADAAGTDLSLWVRYAFGSRPTNIP
ncbi:MAG: TonB-dependent receptor [Flavobacteriales bacterium]|nr:TonB-dependent receptor [Flavobacteriales bacterium]